MVDIITLFSHHINTVEEIGKCNPLLVSYKIITQGYWWEWPNFFIVVQLLLYFLYVTPCGMALGYGLDLLTNYSQLRNGMNLDEDCVVLHSHTVKKS